MRSSAAAKRYARALFSIARDDGAVESVRSDLDAMGGLLDDAPDLRRALFRPLHPVSTSHSRPIQRQCLRWASAIWVASMGRQHKNVLRQSPWIYGHTIHPCRREVPFIAWV